jgi:diaminopimelate decarboxylase
MRRRLAETGAEKVTAAEIAAGDEPPAGLPYPVVLKPAEGVASEDVTLVGSPGELAERCAEFFGRRPGEKLVAEEYLPGTLRTLETLGDGETTWVLGGFLTTMSAPPAGTGSAGTAPAGARVIAPERVVELARKLGADGVPAYVYDLTALDAHAAAIRAALPRTVQFYYAVKANPDLAMLRTLARHADGFEVSSGGELAHAAAAAPGRPLAFGGPGKTPAELAAAGRLVSFGRQWCAGQGVTEPEFNLGGGMAVDYTRPDTVFDWPGYGRGLAGLARPGETLRIEPGRAVTAYCGWYLTRVLDVKHSHGEAFAVVAGGTHHLRTPAAKGHDQPFEVIAVDDWAPPWPRPGVRDEPVTIAGQLCTPKDVLARRVRVSRLRALRVGDLVAFGLPGRTPGTSHTTGSSCIRPLRSIA